ncbi:MAG TPA: four helix bundle protein [Ignavibacteria bacterium]|nr:four helix bundle protein [Ignavibacteria bacterium]HRK00376.1 four helix bundle protein [Ignavibacteria bacterium]
MKENIILEKSYLFAIRIVKLYLYLKNEKREFDLARQILKSGTSIGANTEEAVGGFSRKDFTAKIGVSYKEARETNYWLRLLHDSNILDSKLYNSMKKDCDELLKILSSILVTLKKNNPNS